MDRNPQPRQGIASSPQPELRTTRARVAARPKLSRPSGRRPSFYQSPEKGRREDCDRSAVRAQESALAEAMVVQPLKNLALSLAEATPGRNLAPSAAYATSGRNLGQTASNTEGQRSENTCESSEAPSRATNPFADSPHKGLHDEKLGREAVNGSGNLSIPSVPAYENTVHEPQDLEKPVFIAFAPPKLTEPRSSSSGEHEVGTAAAETLSIPMPLSLHRSNDLRLHRAEIIKGTQPLPTWSAKKWLEQCQEAAQQSSNATEIALHELHICQEDGLRQHLQLNEQERLLRNLRANLMEKQVLITRILCDPSASLISAGLTSDAESKTQEVINCRTNS
ncbi:hypothetical protein BDZ88DRAFT_8432 [Geranomyces variabilis]|nr:hypothetical protein BDZ88DRAFT_8432 [Geranomyces variabilis]